VRLRKPKELAVRIEEFEPPRAMRLREQDDDAVFNVTYELEPAAEGTRLTQRDQIEWTIPRFQQPIGRAMVSRDIRRQLSTLKRLLEAR
jgi:Polyketide cyclase / dehydrase and lipid transport